MGISDDPDATKSLQADIIWVNECGQVPYSIWDEIGGASRARVGLSASGFKQLKIGDLNPMPPAHWTNSLAAPFPQRLFPGSQTTVRGSERHSPREVRSVTAIQSCPLGSRAAQAQADSVVPTG
jgi:hypothetical protein